MESDTYSEGSDSEPSIEDLDVINWNNIIIFY